jgi:SAM-dependent methyltransferase
MKVGIIYGLGKRFEFFEDWIKNEITDSIEIIGVTDKKKMERDYGYPFFDREKLHTINFDEIIVSSDKYYTEISEELHDRYFIPKDKIISLDDIIDEVYKKHFRLEYFNGKKGVEIGGPSEIFGKNIYAVCSGCDGVNFNSDTVWWSQTGEQYIYEGKKLGEVIIADATQLECIENDKYDFVISSNNLEHIANPLKALKEFIRITKLGGMLLLLVPVKDKCFDHNRDYTQFEHIVEDYEKGVLEDDLTHLNEILDKHDLNMDAGIGSYQEFRERSLNNYNNRCLHHHVFCEETLAKMFKYLSLEVIECSKIDINYFILGRKI